MPCVSHLLHSHIRFRRAPPHTARLEHSSVAPPRSSEPGSLGDWSDGDPATRGWETLFAERVPGAQGQQHQTIAGAGHFLQEDAGEQLGQVIAEFVAATRAAD